MPVAHSGSVCQLGFGYTALQPLPLPDHTVSDQPRAFAALNTLVQPTVVTYCDVAGNSTP